MTSFFYDVAKSTVNRALGRDDIKLLFYIGEQIEAADSSFFWSTHHGTKKEDNSPCTVFIFDCLKFRDKLPLARNALKRLKTLRHPDVLKLIDSSETDSQIVIGTELVVPLVKKLVGLDDDLVCFGLFKIATVMAFVNQDCNLIHADLNIRNIFVTKAGDWKLGGFGLMSSLTDDNPILISHGNSLPHSSKYSPPEIKTGSWAAAKRYPMHCIDSWLFGCLIHEIFNGVFSRAEEIGIRGSIPMPLFGPFKLLLSTDPKKRPPISNLIGPHLNAYFDNEVVKVSLFLEQYSLKDSHEKDDFIKKLYTKIDTFPVELCKYKILPELMKALEFGGAGAKALGPILKIGSKLDTSEFDSLISPIIIKLFGSSDRSIRLVLCENIPQFIDHLSSDVISYKIFPNLASGFNDGYPPVREATVKSVLQLAPKLSEKIINNELLSNLAKLQVDEEPGIRTNTTICIGKISKYLNETTKKKILIPAFSRALLDPFTPSRNAGLLAYAATLDEYEPTDICQRVIPSISPLLCDPELSIRKLAFKNINLCLKKAEAYSLTMPAAVVPTALGSPTTPPSVREEGWSTSFISAITTKISSTVRIESPSPSNTNLSAQPTFVSSSVRKNSLKSSSASPAAPVSWGNDQDASEGWGNDGWDLEEVSDNSPSFKPSTTLPKNSKPATAMKFPTKNDGWNDDAAAFNDDWDTPKPSIGNKKSNDGWGDDSGFNDGWDDAPSPKTLSRAGSGNGIDREAEKERRRIKMEQMREERKNKKLGKKI